MSRLSKEPFDCIASTSQEGHEEAVPNMSSTRTLGVTLLSSEWKSTKGGVSTINRELAIQLAKQPNVQVTVYLPECSEDDRQVAANHNVQLIGAEKLHGLEPDLWLSCLPHHHAADCVIGHGVDLGRQVQLIQHQHHCKWIQVVHTDPEELGMFKSNADAIPKGEKQHQLEVKLCELSDQIVAVGPKLADAFSGYLRPFGKDQNVLNLTPGIFSEFAGVKQASEERRTFSVLVLGHGNSEDLQLKGYDIAAKAIAELKDNSQPYKLKVVGAPSGKEKQVAEMFLQQGIDRSQLVVRGFKEREQLAAQFYEVDLAIMPSRSEGFGLAALEALSAGLPVLVSGNSGLGEALKNVLYGTNCVVDSEIPSDWAKAIRNIRQKRRDLRLKETKSICDEYAKKYSWEEQCNLLVQRMRNLVTDKENKEQSPSLVSHNLEYALPERGDISVPSEIRARGARAQLAYVNALKQGKVKVYRARIMLLGQDRAGKTSLKNSFLGLPFNPGEPSTDGITIDPSKFEIDIDQVKNWQRTGEKPFVSQFANDLATMVAEELEKEQPISDNDSDQVMNVGQIEENIDMSQSANDLVKIMAEQVEEGEANSGDQREPKKSLNREETTTNVAIVQEEIAVKESVILDPASPPEEFTQLLIQRLEGLSLQSQAESIENYMTLDLWDFAGQHLYYSSYPVFLSSKAVYVLIYNMSKELQNIAEPCVRVGGVDSHLRNPCGETNLENLLSWLVTVVTMCSGQPTANHMRPAVFIVGTHADKPCGDIKEMESQIKRELLRKDLDHHVIRGVIQDYFSVDNTQGSSCQGVRALQKKMIEVLMQEPYMGEERPVRWFLFERVIQALEAELKTYSLNLKQLKGIIQEQCFITNEDEVDAMLDFYHDLGIIVKHGGTVVLRAQWLIDVLRQLITIRSYKDMSGYSRLWKYLEDTGVLSMELVDHVFSKFGQQGVIREDILDLMEKFGLIVKFQYSPGDEQYFVPSLLKTPPDPLCYQEPSPSDPCALYIHFLGGFVPHGLYSQLVSRCTKWCSDSGVEYAPNFFNGASRFIVGKEFLHQLILLSKKRFIKIILKLRKRSDQEAPTDGETAKLVREFLENTLREMTRELPWFNNLKYKLCVECPYCPKEKNRCCNHGKVFCNHEDCICLLPLLARAQPLCCQKSFLNETLKPVNLNKWFSVKDEEMPVSASFERRSPSYTPPQCKKRRLELTGSVKEGNPSFYELEGLSQEIVHWKSLGRRLNFREAQLHAFHNENSEWREKVYAMLRKWKEGEGEDATYQVLYDALCHEYVKRKDLALKFCCHVEGN